METATSGKLESELNAIRDWAQGNGYQIKETLAGGLALNPGSASAIVDLKSETRGRPGTLDGKIVVPESARPDIALLIGAEGNVLAALTAAPPVSVRGIIIPPEKKTLTSFVSAPYGAKAWSVSAGNGVHYHNAPANFGISFGLWGIFNKLPENTSEFITILDLLSRPYSDPIRKNDSHEDVLVSYKLVGVEGLQSGEPSGLYRPSITLGLLNPVTIDPKLGEVLVELHRFPSVSNDELPSEYYERCPYTTVEGFTIDTLSSDQSYIPSGRVGVRLIAPNGSITKVSALASLVEEDVERLEKIVRNAQPYEVQRLNELIHIQDFIMVQRE